MDPHEPSGGEKKKKVEELRNAWRYKAFMSTLPRWGNIQRSKKGEDQRCPDLETQDWIMKEILLMLECHQCERRGTDECDLMVCIQNIGSKGGEG